MGDVIVGRLGSGDQWSWSYTPTKLEELAMAAGIEPWVLRDWLEAEVAGRRAELEELPPALGAPAEPRPERAI